MVILKDFMICDFVFWEELLVVVKSKLSNIYRIFCISL